MKFNDYLMDSTMLIDYNDSARNYWEILIKTLHFERTYTDLNGDIQHPNNETIDNPINIWIQVLLQTISILKAQPYIELVAARMHGFPC